MGPDVVRNVHASMSVLPAGGALPGARSARRALPDRTAAAAEGGAALFELPPHDPLVAGPCRLGWTYVETDTPLTSEVAWARRWGQSDAPCMGMHVCSLTSSCAHTDCHAILQTRWQCLLAVGMLWLLLHRGMRGDCVLFFWLWSC